MTVPKVFVASSTEASQVVNEVQVLLAEALSGRAEVKPWTEEFQLSKTYIESLERALDTSDFAVIVFTPDDRNKSRGVKTMSPRDNVVLELGLFFGRLGRDRCFLIQRRDLALKLPTDLLGIEVAEFLMIPDQDLRSALESECARIGKAIGDAMTTLPSRPRLGNAERVAQAAIRRFGDRISGTWWERILLNGEAPALSFLTIELDDVHSSVRLAGKAYAADGTHRANWRSAAASLDGQKVLYLRECQRLDAKNFLWRPGLGEVDFVVSGDVINRGDGKFWESDESNPEDTVIKIVELQRNLDESHAATMQEGSERERQGLVLERLASW
jgi:hypothetical protein